jgi:PKD repeat protein
VYVREVPAPVADFNYFISNNAVSFTNASDNETTVLWFFGDSITTTLQNPFHLYADTGCYIVSLVAMNSCASDTLTIALALGVDSVTCMLPSTTIALNNDLSWNVFPNPNTGQFQIEIGSNQSGDAEIALYTTDGRLLKQENHFLQNGINMLHLNWHDLVPGLYLLRLKTEKAILSKRLVILRN